MFKHDPLKALKQELLECKALMEQMSVRQCWTEGCARLFHSDLLLDADSPNRDIQLIRSSMILEESKSLRRESRDFEGRINNGLAAISVHELLQKQKSEEKTTELFRCLKFILPRKNREVITGDIWEDIVEQRSEGWEESRIRRYAMWQFSIILFERFKGVFRWVACLLGFKRLIGWVIGKFNTG